jgi:sugar phosphate isomerase/epimerase
MKRQSIDRRDFLRLSVGAGSLAAVGVGGSSLLSGVADSRLTRLASRERIARVGVQLYTVREAMRQNMERTLEQVARIGFKEVEFAGYFGRSAKDVRALLDANGLTAPSAHSADLNSIRNRLTQLLDDASVIGHRYVVCASLPRSEMTADGYKRVAAEFNRAGEIASRQGIKIAFHNHDGDHVPLGSTTGFDILLAESDPRYFSVQMDLFWTVKGGKDPLDYFAKHPGRFYSVHVKDMAAGGAMVDVGAGSLPFGKYFAQSKQAGIEHYFVEHDTPADPMASIAASYHSLSQLEF